MILGYIYMNRHVKFKDSNMAYEISRTIGPNVNPENVKYKNKCRRHKGIEYRFSRKV